jgi:serine protease Do
MNFPAIESYKVEFLIVWFMLRVFVLYLWRFFSLINGRTKMRIKGFKINVVASRHFFLSSILFLLLFITPLSAVADDQNSITTLRQMGKAFASIAEKASPAVVGISAEKVVKSSDYPMLREWPFAEPFSPFNDDFFEYFFRRNLPRRYRRQPEPRQEARGSGFIISEDGYILTNNHLVEGAEDVDVSLADGRELNGKIVGTDSESDVALVKIDADNLPVIELADSDKLEVGEWVIAIGNPFGLTRTVTAGIVSAKGRSGFRVAEFEDFIQTDAAINPGNSGGPLLNLDGKVVGMNTAILGSSGNIGIGLAIPINLAKFVYQQLIDTGTVVYGHLGIWFRELTPDLAAALGLGQDTKGTVITEVIGDSAADKAGLKRYDVIVEFNDQPVENGNEFRNYVAKLRPGTKVKIVVIREGERKTIIAELGTYKAGEQVMSSESGTTDKLGIIVEDLNDEIAGRLGYEGLSGVVVTSVEAGSEAKRKGIEPGMLIMEVNRKPVENRREFYNAIEQAFEKGVVLLLINDGRSTVLIPLKFSRK